MNKIIEILYNIWDKLKKIFVAIFDFSKNIAMWFKNKYNKIIRKYPNVKPISLKIKKMLKDGDYNTIDIDLRKDVIVNTFFDEETNEILEEHTEVIEFGEIDKQTLEKFGDKEMILMN